MNKTWSEIFIIITAIYSSSALSHSTTPESTTPPPSSKTNTSTANHPADEIAQANNPLANLKALNIQNYYMPNISGTDTSGDIFWLRYAQPLGKFLIRASIPFQTFPVGLNGSRQTGTSDFNIFALYTFDTGNPSVSTGIGPLLVAPTASPSILGAGKWQGGLAGVYYNASSRLIQYGGLVTYQADFAGNQTRQHTNILDIQPFLFIQLGHGLYLRTAPVWTFNFISSTNNLPVSLGIGKIVKMNKTVYNFFIEPQVSAYHKGLGQPTTQIYAAVNIQFYD